MSFVSAPVRLQRLSHKRALLVSSTICPRRENRAAVNPVRMGLIPFIPNWIALASWAYGAYRFYQGYDRTSYQSSFRVPLAVAWPILFAINGSYRENFAKSIKGSDDGF